VINRLRWHLHELDPSFVLPARTLHRAKNLHAISARLDDLDPSANAVVLRLARELHQRCAQLTQDIAGLENELQRLIVKLAPGLLAVVGCAALTAAKILGETAGIDRFPSKDAYARYTGTAPVPVWTGNRERHRLSRVGNRQLNTALHRIAITQAHYHPDARRFLARRRANGDTKPGSLRALKRRLSDVVYRTLRQDLERTPPSAAPAR
jgi:transposase